MISKKFLKIVFGIKEEELKIDYSNDGMLAMRIRIAIASWGLGILSVLLFVAIGLRQSWWLLVPGTVALIALRYWVKYFVVSYRDYSRSRRVGELDKLQLPSLSIMERSKEFAISAPQARLYLELSDPISGRFERITEYIEQHVRSVTISTSLTLKLPDHKKSVALVIPLVFHRRGELIDNFRIFDSSDKRISSMTQLDSTAFAVAIIRKYIRQAGKLTLERYEADGIESRVVDILRGIDPGDLPIVEEVCAEIVGLPLFSIRRKYLLISASRILLTHSERYPVSVVVGDHGDRVDSVVESNVSEASTVIVKRVRLRYERREIPRLNFQGNRTENRWRDFLRSVLGVRPSIIQIPLGSADRAESYHLQIRGPEGTYLGRQRIVRGGGHEVRTRNSIMRSRNGQRYSHLYLRDYWQGLSQFYENTFFERPPGSVAVASLSAIASTFLVSLVAVSSLGITSVPFSGAVTTLLVVPAAIGAWSGLEQSRTMTGGVLAARISTLVTIAVTFTGIVFYSIIDHTESFSTAAWNDRDGSRAWLSLLFLSVMNSVIITGSWYLRTLVYRRFIGRPD